MLSYATPQVRKAIMESFIRKNGEMMGNRSLEDLDQAIADPFDTSNRGKTASTMIFPRIVG